MPIDELESSSDETGELKCPFWRHERTHVGSQGRSHDVQELVPEERENTCRSHRADTSAGGAGVKWGSRRDLL